VAQRSRAQALSRVARNLGMAAAGVAGGVLAQADFRWVFFVSAAMTMLALLWFVRTTWRRPVLVVEDESIDGSSLPYRDKPFLWLLAATAVLGIAFDTVYSTLGNYLRDYYHLSTEAIGWQ
ncbi:MFS transporter, partial [Pseudomonas viridiflava]